MQAAGMCWDCCVHAVGLAKRQSQQAPAVICIRRLRAAVVLGAGFWVVSVWRRWVFSFLQGLILGFGFWEFVFWGFGKLTTLQRLPQITSPPRPVHDMAALACCGAYPSLASELPVTRQLVFGRCASSPPSPNVHTQLRLLRASVPSANSPTWWSSSRLTRGARSRCTAVHAHGIPARSCCLASLVLLRGHPNNCWKVESGSWLRPVLALQGGERGRSPGRQGDFSFPCAARSA